MAHALALQRFFSTIECMYASVSTQAQDDGLSLQLANVRVICGVAVEETLIDHVFGCNELPPSVNPLRSPDPSEQIKPARGGCIPNREPPEEEKERRYKQNGDCERASRSNGETKASTQATGYGGRTEQNRTDKQTHTVTTMVKGESNGVHVVNGILHQSSSAAAAKPTLTVTRTPSPPPSPVVESKNRCLWFEEELEQDLRWVFGVSKILHSGVSEYQNIELVESGPFGKVLILDGKLQSAEADEFVYHESIVHPALLHHSKPKNVFIMGGGEGSTAREALKHRSVEEVVMCDIDEEVVNFCRKHLTVNAEAFRSDRLELVINCARAELEKRTEQFDIIIGDLADPVEGGPCYQLYTKSFYENVLKPRLKEGGILVTQGGPAGILSHTEVYSSIYNTLRETFKHVVPFAAHVPSYADTWGWVMASDAPLSPLSPEEIDTRIHQRIDGELKFLDGQTLSASIALNKHVRKSLAAERHVYTEETARFIHGHGTAVKN